MYTPELIRKLRAYAKEHDFRFEIVKHRGKGSHQTIHLGNAKTIVPFSSKELKPGTLHDILKQLGVTKL